MNRIEHLLLTVGGVILAIFVAGLLLEEAGKGSFGQGVQGIAANITRGYGAPNA